VRHRSGHLTCARELTGPYRKSQSERMQFLRSQYLKASSTAETLLVFSTHHMLEIRIATEGGNRVGSNLRINFERQRRNLAPDADTTLRLQQISTRSSAKATSTRYMTLSSTPLLA
jgi:hypothetical protein